MMTFACVSVCAFTHTVRYCHFCSLCGCTECLANNLFLLFFFILKLFLSKFFSFKQLFSVEMPRWHKFSKSQRFVYSVPMNTLKNMKVFKCVDFYAILLHFNFDNGQKTISLFSFNTVFKPILNSSLQIRVQRWQSVWQLYRQLDTQQIHVIT